MKYRIASLLKMREFVKTIFKKSVKILRRDVEPYDDMDADFGYMSPKFTQHKGKKRSIPINCGANPS
jgi:hypothetical protein